MNTKIKKSYIIQLILFTIFFIWVTKLIAYIFSLVKTFDYPFSPWTYFVIIFFINLLFGVLLGLEHLRNEKKSNGKWRVNVQKLIILGIPALIISCGSFIYYSGSIHKAEWVLAFFASLVYSNNPTMSLVQVLLGYTLATSIYKNEVNGSLTDGSSSYIDN